MLCTHKTTIFCQFGNLEICPNFANPYLTQLSSISGGNCIRICLHLMVDHILIQHHMRFDGTIETINVPGFRVLGRVGCQSMMILEFVVNEIEERFAHLTPLRVKSDLIQLTFVHLNVLSSTQPLCIMSDQVGVEHLSIPIIGYIRVRVLVQSW